MFNRIDENEDNKISYKEFYDAAKENPCLVWLGKIGPQK